MSKAIDWSSLREIPVRKLDLLAERMKLMRLKERRAKRPKNHSTNKERSALDRSRAATHAKEQKSHNKRLSDYRDNVRAYWAGLRETHPRSRRDE